jgi:hypothetical protein
MHRIAIVIDIAPHCSAPALALADEASALASK